MNHDARHRGQLATDLRLLGGSLLFVVGRLERA
jgi:uncharacterized damage-inducible protein DinB